MALTFDVGDLRTREAREVEAGSLVWLVGRHTGTRALSLTCQTAGSESFPCAVDLSGDRAFELLTMQRGLGNYRQIPVAGHEGWRIRLPKDLVTESGFGGPGALVITEGACFLSTVFTDGLTGTQVYVDLATFVARTDIPPVLAVISEWSLVIGTGRDAEVIEVEGRPAG